MINKFKQLKAELGTNSAILAIADVKSLDDISPRKKSLHLFKESFRPILLPAVKFTKTMFAEDILNNSTCSIAIDCLLSNYNSVLVKSKDPFTIEYAREIVNSALTTKSLTDLHSLQISMRNTLTAIRKPDLTQQFAPFFNLRFNLENRLSRNSSQFLEILKTKHLLAPDCVLSKCTELYSLILSKNNVLICGEVQSGKTTIMLTLIEALNNVITYVS
ncbi:hypothetical protein GJ496_001301 [Pomphorhynchus laevis]|nr:hypothetical protein GJ496_001301 [Pomphorhynchus laevis]